MIGTSEGAAQYQEFQPMPMLILSTTCHTLSIGMRVNSRPHHPVYPIQKLSAGEV